MDSETAAIFQVSTTLWQLLIKMDV